MIDSSEVDYYNNNDINMPKISVSVKRGVVSLFAFAIPVLVAHFPEYMNLSIGALLNGMLHYLEKTYTNL